MLIYLKYKGSTVQKQIDKIIELIDKVEPEEKKKIAVAINKLKSKIKEDTQIDHTQAKTYVTQLTTQALEKGILLQYPSEELVKTKKSVQYKETIQEIIKQFDVVADLNNPALSLAWNRVKKSTSVLELRSNLEMYICIKENIQKEDIQEYVDIIDEQDSQIKQLQDYKRIQEELFGIIREDDEELKMLSDIENAKKNLNLTDNQVCMMFKCDRNRLNRLRKKFELTIL